MDKEKGQIVGETQSMILKENLLQIIDFSWRAHLQYLEQLRQVIGLRTMAKDPLSEFKKEAFRLFEGLLEKIKIDLIKFLINLNIVVTEENEQQPKKEQKTITNKKVGRNDKCPCGSRKNINIVMDQSKV